MAFAIGVMWLAVAAISVTIIVQSHRAYVNRPPEKVRRAGELGERQLTALKGLKDLILDEDKRIKVIKNVMKGDDSLLYTALAVVGSMFLFAGSLTLWAIVV